MLAFRTAINSVVSSGDPYFANVSLLLHFDGTNGSTTFTDSSSNNLTLSASGTTISTTNTMAGFGQVAKFNGSNSILSVTNNLVNFSGSDFTVEFWFYAPDVFSTYILIESGTGATGDTQSYLYNNSIFWGTSGSLGQVSMPVTANAWHFFCGIKSGSSYYFYLDGVKSSAITRTANSKTLLNIGARSPGSLRFNGNIDEFRMTKNVVRQSGSSMTVPTGPFPNS